MKKYFGKLFAQSGHSSFLLMLLISLISQGQVDSLSNLLKPVVLYGNLLETENIETGKNITIIHSSQMENYQFNSIDELLKNIPSIELQSKGDFGVQSDITMRGTTFSQTLVLLDGMRVNDPLTGHFSMYIPINPSEIHQIEIIRGGNSSIYGPDAVGGVINIVTKSFANKIDENEILWEHKIGSNKLRGGNIFISNNINQKLYSSISGNIIKSDGQELYENTYSFFDNQTYSTSHHYKFNNNLSIILRSSYAKRYFDTKYFYTTSAYDQSNELIEKSWIQTRVNYMINKTSSIQLNSAYQSVNDIYVFNPDFPIYENTTNLLNSRINYVQKKKHAHLVAGFDIQKKSMVSSNRGDHDDSYIGAFINYIRFKNKLSLNPSIRLDYNKHYNINISPQIAMSYKYNKFNFRTSINKSIRSADFTERFYQSNYDGVLPSGQSIGNPELDVEKSINYEFGIDLLTSKDFQLKNTIFYRNASNLIDWVATNSNEINTDLNLVSNEIYYYAQNISRLYTLGYETELWFSMVRKKNIAISGSTGYTKIYSAESRKNILNQKSNSSSKYLANNSGDRFNYNLLIKYKKTRFNLNGIMKIRNAEFAESINQGLKKSYFIHNLSAKYPIQKKLLINIEIKNIFNKEYSDILGAILPKRWLILGAAWQIQ